MIVHHIFRFGTWNVCHLELLRNLYQARTSAHVRFCWTVVFVTVRSTGSCCIHSNTWPVLNICCIICKKSYALFAFEEAFQEFFLFETISEVFCTSTRHTFVRALLVGNIKLIGGSIRISWYSQISVGYIDVHNLSIGKVVSKLVTDASFQTQICIW